MVRFYLKLIFLAGVPFGACMGALTMLFAGPTAAILSGVYSGVAFGLGMGAVHVGSTAGLSRRDRYAVRHSASLTLPLARDEALARCRESLKAIPGSSIRTENKAEGKLEATTCMTLKSSGERLRFTLAPVDPANTSVRVSSRPSVRTAFIDCGKNYENIDAIRRTLIGPANDDRQAAALTD